MPDTAIQIKDLFQELKTEWKVKSRYMSNTAQIATVWEYQQIIGMGRPALPLILKELEQETDHWFWALEAISGDDPVPPDHVGDVEKMAKTWIEWGKQKGII